MVQNWPYFKINGIVLTSFYNEWCNPNLRMNEKLYVLTIQIWSDISLVFHKSPPVVNTGEFWIIFQVLYRVICNKCPLFVCQIWVRKTSDSTKMRIYLGQLQRGAFVIRRRSAAWTLTSLLSHPICPSSLDPLDYYFYSSRVRPARGLWFLRTPKQTKCIFALHFSKTSTVVIVCTADGWSIICHHVAGVRRQHNNTNLFHIIQALFKSIGILILKPSGGEIQ